MIEIEPRSQTILEAIREAETNMLCLIQRGEIKWPSTAFDGLVALAVHTGMVLEGGPTPMTFKRIVHLARFIATTPDYIPGPLFTYQKEQLLQAWFGEERIAEE